MMYKPESDEEAKFLAEYDPAKYPVTMLTVDTIITRHGHNGFEVVLIKRKNFPYKDHWALPGGFMDSDERAEDAARREVIEEAGMDLERLSFFTVADNPDRDPRGRAVSMVFMAESDGEPFAGDDAVEARWFSMGQVQLMRLAFDHNVLVAQAWLRLLETS
jgi:8-oxo-dGTP diphosphatase